MKPRDTQDGGWMNMSNSLGTFASRTYTNNMGMTGHVEIHPHSKNVLFLKNHIFLWMSGDSSCL